MNRPRNRRRLITPPKTQSLGREPIMSVDGKNLATTDMSQAAEESTMQAIVQDRYGPAETLRSARITRPDIADHEVLVQGPAAGLDRGTWHLMTGRPYLMRVMGFGFRRPENRLPGVDVAGTVVAIGSAVTRFAVGDEVFGTCQDWSASCTTMAICTRLATSSLVNRRETCALTVASLRNSEVPTCALEAPEATATAT